MSGWLIGIVTVIYVLCAASFAWDGHYAKALIFLGYVVANLGFILDV
jgi:hypothetical protein